MIRVYIAYAAADRAIAERLRELLQERGIDVWPDRMELAAGESYRDWVEAAIRDCYKVLLLWSANSVQSEYVRREAILASASGKLLPVRLGATAPPNEFANVNTFDLSAWAGDRHDPRIRRLLDALRPTVLSSRRSDDDVERSTSSAGATGFPAPTPSIPSQSRPEVGAPSAPPSMLGRAVDRIRELWTFGSRKKEIDEPMEATRTGGKKKDVGEAMETTIIGAKPTRKPGPVEVMEPVWLGASAPRHCTPGQRFTAALVAYVDAARESAKEKLSALGEPDDRVVMDVAPQHNASWRVGAPVSVRLTGEGVDVTPVEVRFEWNGRENLAAFAARVRDDAPATVSLCFEVFVAEVPIAFIPMRLTAAAQTASLAVQQAQASAPSSVFASYSSKDAQPVTQRLSSLQRWSPKLDIFQDCLDLQPNASFQPQIKMQIARREVFLLFWSRNAAASPWVQWEYRTARDTRGLDAILPMPLEDPAIAPPPSELADRHLRDRFMLAGYGLAKIRDEAACPPTS